MERLHSPQHFSPDKFRNSISELFTIHKMADCGNIHACVLGRRKSVQNLAFFWVAVSGLPLREKARNVEKAPCNNYVGLVWLVAGGSLVRLWFGLVWFGLVWFGCRRKPCEAIQFLLVGGYLPMSSGW